MMKDRRKRLSVPLSLKLAGLIFISLPIFNYFLINRELGLHQLGPFVLLKVLNPLQTILLLLPFPIGIGLFLGRKLAWWSLLVYISCLILYDAVQVYMTADFFNIGALFRSLVGIALILFFLRKDISAPYFKMYPRGWRGQKRTP